VLEYLESMLSKNAEVFSPYLRTGKKLANYATSIRVNGSELQHWILKWFDT